MANFTLCNLAAVDAQPAGDQAQTRHAADCMGDQLEVSEADQRTRREPERPGPATPRCKADDRRTRNPGGTEQGSPDKPISIVHV